MRLMGKAWFSRQVSGDEDLFLISLSITQEVKGNGDEQQSRVEQASLGQQE